MRQILTSSVDWSRAALAAAALSLVGVLALASGAHGQTSARPPAHALPAPGPNGEALYKARCAGCHDNATDRTPSREVISKNPASFILSTITNGEMAPMATGLSAEERTAIARFVSKAPAGTEPMKEIDPKLIWGDGVANTPLDAPQCASGPSPVDLAAQDQWNGWSPTHDNMRFQKRPGLATADVSRLKLKWAFQYPGAKNGQATVIGDRLFVTSMSGAVYALNAKTGCVYWRHAAGAATRSSVAVAALPKGSGARTALFFSDWTKSAVALDADTGKPLWKTVIDDQAGMQMTGSLIYWDGKVYVPIASGVEAFAQFPGWECCKFRGALVALDAATGKILWKRYTTEATPKQFRLNSAGKPMFGPSGGSIWVAPTVDARRRLLYVGTSNSYTDVPYDHANSVVAIDADTGAIRWAKKLEGAPDNYIDGCYRTGAARPINCPEPLGADFEIGTSPILHSLPGGGEVLLVGQKSGILYALDPAKEGAIVWQKRLSEGSALGGIEFGTAADDKHVYAGVSDVVLGAKGKPGLWALDIATGNTAWNWANTPKPTCRWQGFWCHGAVSQAISVIPGVVFAGAYDGHFRAFDTGTGKIVWDVDTATDPIKALNGKMVYGGVFDGAGPTIAGGMVYVHSGYAGRSGSTAGRDMRNADGNVLMAFSIDGK